MATIEQTYRAKYLEVLADNESRLKKFYKRLMDALWIVFLPLTDGTGHIPQGNRPTLKYGVQRAVYTAFLGDAGAGRFIPYTMTNGVILSHSDFMNIVVPTVTAMALLAVEQQAAILKSSDIILSSNRRTLRATRDALGNYIAPFNQVLADGKSFAERLPFVATLTYQRMWYYMLMGLDDDDSAAILLSKVSVWINGHGDYPGRRLARGEALRTFTTIGQGAAQLNPSVSSYSIVTSPLHRDTDHCDEVEAGSPYELNDVEHLAPLHALCMCAVIWERGNHNVDSNALSPIDTQALSQLLLVG